MFVSIIIPTHNRQGPVLRAIDSVLRQSHTDFELIVVDDGSTDNTRVWLKKIPDKRLFCHFTKKQGVAAARNHGASLARAEWLCFLDSDDVWHKHKLRKQVLYHEQNPDCLISQTDEAWIRNSQRINKMKKHETKEGYIFKESLLLCLISPSAVMLNKKLFLDAGGFDETLPVCEDYDLWLRLVHQHAVGYINTPLVTKFGGHNDQLSKSLPVMDHYRILALEKLLNSATKLFSEQKQWILDALAIKRNIISRGENKHRGQNETIIKSQNK